MEKLASLRAAIVAANPGLAVNPQSLSIFVDKGRMVSRRTAALGFEYRYRTRLWLQDFTASPDHVMVPLLIWLRTHQPELLLNFDGEDSAIGFSADVIDEKSWDILIEIELVEAVTVTERAEGGWQLARVTEPSADDMLLDGATADIGLDQLWIGADRIL